MPRTRLSAVASSGTQCPQARRAEVGMDKQRAFSPQAREHLERICLIPLNSIFLTHSWQPNSVTRLWGLNALIAGLWAPAATGESSSFKSLRGSFSFSFFSLFFSRRSWHKLLARTISLPPSLSSSLSRMLECFDGGLFKGESIMCSYSCHLTGLKTDHSN